MKPTLPATIALLALSLASANAQGTGFNYQGRLLDGTNLANGVYDFRFSVWDASSGGFRLGNPILRPGLTVSNGFFGVTLDFGEGIFTGQDRWLQIVVKTNLPVGYTLLSPRQEILPLPYSITAGNLSGILPTAQLSGTLPLEQLPPVVQTTVQSRAVGTPPGSFHRDWMRRENTSPYDLNDDGAWTVFANTNELWAKDYVMLTNFPGVEGSCVFVARSNNVNVPSLYWTFTNLDNIRGIDVELLWVTNGANTTSLNHSRLLNISFSEKAQLFSGNLFSLSGANGAHFNYHWDAVQLHFFTNAAFVAYTEEDHLGRGWVDTWTGKEPGTATFKPKHGSIWHCGYEFMSPTTIRVYSGPNEYIRSLDFFTEFDNVRSFWLESVANNPTNLGITACLRSVTVFTHHKNTWPRWFYVTTNGMVLTQTVVTN